jgi:hypothetical protein
MRDAELHTGPEFFREFAERDQVPFVRQGPMLTIQAEEVYFAVLLDDLLELAAGGLDGCGNGSDRFALVHFLFQRSGLRLECAPAWGLTESGLGRRSDAQRRHAENSPVHGFPSGMFLPVPH